MNYDTDVQKINYATGRIKALADVLKMIEDHPENWPNPRCSAANVSAALILQADAITEAVMNLLSEQEKRELDNHIAQL
jgi:hypothetical protein